jgi:hypothetical protein
MGSAFRSTDTIATQIFLTLDIELALCLIRLLEGPYAVEKSSIIGMVENAIINMTNPCARKLLEDKTIRH